MQQEASAHHDTTATQTDTAPKAKATAKARTNAAKPQKKGGSVKNTIEETIEESHLPHGQQSLLPKRRLATKVARTKKGRKKKGGGLEPALEHHDIKDDPYYMKPPLLTYIK